MQYVQNILLYVSVHASIFKFSFRFQRTKISRATLFRSFAPDPVRLRGRQETEPKPEDGRRTHRGGGGGSVTTGDVSSEAIPGQSGRGVRARQRDRG